MITAQLRPRFDAPHCLCLHAMLRKQLRRAGRRVEAIPRRAKLTQNRQRLDAETERPRECEEAAPDYTPNTLRSEADCLSSGYPIHRSQVFEN